MSGRVLGVYKPNSVPVKCASASREIVIYLGLRSLAASSGTPEHRAARDAESRFRINDLGMILKS